MGQRAIVRCEKNIYNTPLFSYDSSGIYVRCKDCRTIDSHSGAVKRGVYHLYTWGDLLKMALGLYVHQEIEHAETGSSTGSPDQPDEIDTGVGELSQPAAGNGD